jgi:cytoskeletal protein CcmA (bactofilin family)
MDTTSGDEAPLREGARPTEITALLGRGTAFEGKLSFFGRVRIDGHFVGEIRGDDVLVIGDGALVEGTIEVSTCIVTAGEVHGDIRAREAIELYSPARVTGSLHAPAIFIDRGVVFEGTCTMAPLPEASDVEDAAAQASEPRSSAQQGTTEPGDP